MFKSVFAFSFCNISRWKKDYRVWLVFIFTMLIIIEYLKGYTIYGMAEGKKMTFCLLPLLYPSSEISIGAPKLLWHIGFILLLCDAPFLYQSTPYIIMRSGRKNWWIGECLYIFEAAFIYMSFIAIVSSAVSLPVISFENDWGEALTDFISGTDTKTVNDLLSEYKLGISEPTNAVRMLYPFACQAYTFFTGIASFTILGLLIYCINVIQKNVLLGLGAAFVLVFLDPVLSYLAWPSKYWLHVFSPVCWTTVDCIDIVWSKYFISIPFVTVASLIIIIILIVLIALSSRKVIVEVRED